MSTSVEFSSAQLVFLSDVLRSLQSVSLLAGSSSNTLTERLLRQNAELTGFVSRLTEEKNDLRNHTLRLEEEVRRYRRAAPGGGDSVSFSCRVSECKINRVRRSDAKSAE